ncbi:unnamed protein product, partial [Hapterophycus canaliculatus]
QLLKAGYDVNTQNRSEATALHVAVNNGKLSAVRLLVAWRAGLDAPDWCKRTPLHYACDFARLNGMSNTIAEELIFFGANVHSLDRCRWVC